MENALLKNDKDGLILIVGSVSFMIWQSMVALCQTLLNYWAGLRRIISNQTLIICGIGYMYTLRLMI
jgi:hypothetical protein